MLQGTVKPTQARVTGSFYLMPLHDANPQLPMSNLPTPAAIAGVTRPQAAVNPAEVVMREIQPEFGIWFPGLVLISPLIGHCLCYERRASSGADANTIRSPRIIYPGLTLARPKPNRPIPKKPIRNVATVRILRSGFRTLWSVHRGRHPAATRVPSTVQHESEVLALAFRKVGTRTMPVSENPVYQDLRS
jgi:hypothetical protein